MLIPLYENNDPFPRSKIRQTLYHGSNNQNLTEFDTNFDWDNNEYARLRDFELPPGYIFLTDDYDYAKGYGGKVLSVKINARKVYSVDVGSTPPSIAFDNDYNGDATIWHEFMDSGADVLAITGENRNGKLTTYITYPECCKVIPDDK